MKSDIMRAFTSMEFYIGILGILSAVFFGCSNEVFEGNTVLHLMWYSTFGVQFLFVMIFGAVPYAGSVCEDLEHKYIYQILIRSNLRNYCISKVITVFLSSVGSFMAGMTLFVVILRCRLPWIDINDSVYQSAVKSGSFQKLLSEELFYLYTILFSLQLGMLIGILSLISACISLFITNKLLVLSIPIMAYYFITQYIYELFPENIFYNLDFIYGGKRNLFHDDMISFLYAVLITFIIGVILTYLFYVGLKRRISGER